MPTIIQVKRVARVSNDPGDYILHPPKGHDPDAWKAEKIMRCPYGPLVLWVPNCRKDGDCPACEGSAELEAQGAARYQLPRRPVFAMKTPAEFIQETTGPFIQKHPNALSDADATVIFDREEKRRQKQYAKAVKEAKKDPEYMDSGFTVAGDLVIWKRPVIDPRVAVLMSQRLRPADIVFGKPCKRCASEARYHSGACIVCNRTRKRADRDFFSKQLPLFEGPAI